MIYREAESKDKEFILEANKEINELSGISVSYFDKRIDKDLFEDKIFKSIVAELDGQIVGFILYSYIYWANHGNGIYLSQAYVRKEYRGKGIYKDLLKELENKEKDCHFVIDFVGKDNEVMKTTLNKMGYTLSDLVTYYRFINKD